MTRIFTNTRNLALEKNILLPGLEPERQRPFQLWVQCSAIELSLLPICFIRVLSWHSTILPHLLFVLWVGLVFCSLHSSCHRFLTLTCQTEKCWCMNLSAPLPLFRQCTSVLLHDNCGNSLKSRKQAGRNPPNWLLILLCVNVCDVSTLS